jgi:transcriptional regulator GlxA family with amidase domain
MRRAPRRVWVLASPGAEMLGVTGPWAVLGHANDALGRQAYAPELVTVAGGGLRTGHGLDLAGARSLRSATRLGLPDDVIVAGCPRAVLGLTPEPGFVAWLRRHHARIPRLISICGGAFTLGEAGLLDGRRATTHWRLLGDLRRRFPSARVVDDEIYARDGRVWTSAGITAGIDLMLALVEEDHGHAVAMSVAKVLVLFLRRSGRQAQFSEALKRQESEPPRLRDLSAIVLEHLGEDLPVARLAQRLGMSARTLTRWCHDELHESPAALVRRSRIEEARRLLAETDLPLKAVSARTGLGDASTLWRVFTRHLGISPAEYRDRFGARDLLYAAGLARSERGDDDDGKSVRAL